MSRCRVNLEGVYDQQREIKTGNDAVEVYGGIALSHCCMGVQTEQSEVDTRSEYGALEPMM